MTDPTPPAPVTDLPAVPRGANMEDCPRCDDPNPPYPWICPGHPAEPAPETAVADVPPEPTPAARVEVRDPCPYCGDHQLIPRRQMVEHVSRLHPDEPLRRVPRLAGPAADGLRAGLLAGTRDLSIPVDKNGPTIANQQVNSGKRVDNAADNAPAPDGLRERYAAAMRAAVSDAPTEMDDGEETVIQDLADAVIAVRDEELQRLRDQAAAHRLQIDDLIGRNSQYAARAIANGERADKAEAATDRVRRLCEITIAVSVRAHAIEQALDTLDALTPQETL